MIYYEITMRRENGDIIRKERLCCGNGFHGQAFCKMEIAHPFGGIIINGNESILSTRITIDEQRKVTK